MKTLFNILSRAFDFASKDNEYSSISSGILYVFKAWLLISILTVPCIISFFITEYLK